MYRGWVTTDRVRIEAVLVGRRIAEARRRAGISQADLARRLGCHASYVGRVETGAAVPSLPSLWRWAEALGATRAELVGDEPIG